MKPNPSIKEQLQEILEGLHTEHQTMAAGKFSSSVTRPSRYTLDQATEAILKIIESEVIQARQNEWDYVFDFFDTAQDEARDHFRAMYNDLKQDRA